ncbi:hypothetical protein F4678DRAFT_406512 [Xylaria arbuscula]|nr:hypothetical protein F4678DRAFT_406512 [Xylaria arbuscula]
MVGHQTDMYQAQDGRPEEAPKENFYQELKQTPSIVYIYCPDPSKSSTSQEWTARLTVKSPIMYNILCAGLEWNNSNIVQEEAYFSDDFSDYYRVDGKQWHSKSHYFLKDMKLEPPSWVATIEVVTLYDQTMRPFDMDQLSQRTLHVVSATSEKGHLIHASDYSKRGPCFTMAYDEYLTIDIL